jgi:proline iminopeptidase
MLCSVNGAFLRGESALLRNVDRIRHLPCVMVQGQLDFVCPMRTALDLKSAWPEAELRLVPGAGHSMYEPGITHELVSAVEQMETLF